MDLLLSPFCEYQFCQTYLMRGLSGFLAMGGSGFAKFALGVVPVLEISLAIDGRFSPIVSRARSTLSSSST